MKERLTIPEDVLRQLVDQSISKIERVKLSEEVRERYGYAQRDMVKLAGIPCTTYCRYLKVIRSGNRPILERIASGNITVAQARDELKNETHAGMQILFEKPNVRLYIAGGVCYLERRLAKKRTLIRFNADCGKDIQQLLKNGYVPTPISLKYTGKKAYNYKLIALANVYGCTLNTTRFGGMRNTNSDPSDYRTDRLTGTGVVADYRLSRTSKNIYLYVPSRGGSEGVMPYVTGYNKRLWTLLCMCSWHLIADKYPAYTVKNRNICLHSLVFIENLVPPSWSAAAVLRFAVECRQSKARNICHFDQNEHNNRISNLANMPQHAHKKMDCMIRKMIERESSLDEDKDLTGEVIGNEMEEKF